MKYLLLISLASSAQTGVKKCGSPITDARDKQTYQTVLIGNQCWMKQNINIGKFVTDLKQSDNQIIEKTCYQNNKKWCGIMGGLYTWEEAMQYQQDEQGICPAGWKIPTKDEWQILADYLGQEEAGQKLKASTSDSIYKWDGNNESGFSAFPSGAANHSYFKRIDQWALFWTSTPENNERAWFAQLDSYWYPEPPKYKTLYIGNYYLKTNGFSIRCLKDE